MSLVALVLAAGLQTAAAAPTAPASAPVKAAPSADANGGKIECHTEMITGSHFTTRDCRTHAEWQHLHDESVDAMNRRGHDPHPGMGPS